MGDSGIVTLASAAALVESVVAQRERLDGSVVLGSASNQRAWLSRR